jgi:hypothetical protein
LLSLLLLLPLLACSFAVMGLVINYTGLRDPSKPGSAVQSSIFQHFLS